MPENIIETFDALGKEIRALKKELEYKVWEIDALKAKNDELRGRAENFEQELKAAYAQLDKYTKLNPCKERGCENA